MNDPNNMKKWFLSLLGTCLVGLLNAQTTPPRTPDSKILNIGVNVIFPLGDFSSTHFGGIGVDASPSRHFEKSLRKKKIVFTYNGGINYYIGKKETVSANNYKYPGYVFIHAFGGLLYVPAKKIALKIMTGPGLGIYNGTTRFTIGGKFEAGYSVSNRVSIGPGFLIMKDPGANPLWGLSLKTTMDF